MRPRAQDLAFALIATVVEFAMLIDGSDGVSVLGLGLTAVACAALMFRRRAPLPVLAVTLAAELGVLAAGDYPGGAPILVALFTVADQLSWPVAFAALVPTVLALALGDMVSPAPVFAAFGVGAAVRARRGELAAGERMAVQRERAAIARELHDIVAHSVTVMLVGVRGARDVLRTSPEVADETLARVETSGEQSLAELRRVLDVLRDPDAAVDTRPQPSLEQLDELVAEAGVPARLEIAGERRSLPEGVELSAYRIVQEALTNVRKHANASEVVVRLAYGRTLRIEVSDDGAGDRGGAGRGLVGMRERVALLGGELVTGSLPGCGFQVTATLPTR
jgi:signal transduction histidine kinase